MSDDDHFDPLGRDRPETKVSCLMCKWEGALSECRESYVCTGPESWASLAGREGQEWYCPRCGFVVNTHYWRMS